MPWDPKKLHRGRTWVATQPMLYENSLIRTLIDDKGNFSASTTIEKQKNENDTVPKIKNYFVPARNPCTVSYPLFAQVHPTKGLLINHLADPELGQKVFDLSGYSFVCFASTVPHKQAEIVIIAVEITTS